MTEVTVPLLIVPLLLVVPFLWIAAITGSIDAVSRSAPVWAEAGCRRSRWVWQAAGVVLLPLTLPYSGWYFARIRPRLVAAERRLGVGYLQVGAPRGGVMSGARGPISDAGAPMATVKIRLGPGQLMIALFPQAPLLVVNALFLWGRGPHRHQPPLFLSIFSVVVVVLALAAQSWFGVNLTSRGVVVNSLRRRRIDWADIQAVTQEPFLGSTRVVLWTTARDRVPLRAPILGLTSLGRRRFDRGFHTIGQTWLARRDVHHGTDRPEPR